MSDLVFVDTNVFVYARDASESVKQPFAAEWIEQLWVEQRGRTSMQVLSEYYATLTRKLDPGLSPDEAWEDVEALLTWEPQEIGREVLILARGVERRYKLSWWDSMIVAAAQVQNCAVLLTEDLQHGLVCGTVTIRNPFEDRVAEGAGHYAATPKVVSRHRAPGRPRRRGAPIACR